MANWKKLNKEFRDLIDNISDEDFDKWYDNREVKKQIRRQQMQIEASIQELKLQCEQVTVNTISFSSISLEVCENIKNELPNSFIFSCSSEEIMEFSFSPPLPTHSEKEDSTKIAMAA